ncbi:hypothetical protein EJB05_30368 [Eragrostis curvula]|uniref:Uncharacterized protein n=1 Tax=Eragrostis curvula TaxID=38414 RepID=A0A5J9UAL7_9POAL|nr:hypothetical protein EJB05_30368 [Eragrostis curvula]
MLWHCNMSSFFLCDMVLAALTGIEAEAICESNSKHGLFALEPRYKIPNQEMEYRQGRSREPPKLGAVGPVDSTDLRFVGFGVRLDISVLDLLHTRRNQVDVISVGNSEGGQGGATTLQAESADYP